MLVKIASNILTAHFRRILTKMIKNKKPKDKSGFLNTAKTPFFKATNGFFDSLKYKEGTE